VPGSQNTAPAEVPVGSSSGGLSTGAQIGIGVGVGLAVLTILVAGAVFCYRRGKAAGAKRASQGGEDAESSNAQATAAKANDEPISELDTEEHPLEMAASAEARELHHDETLVSPLSPVAGDVPRNDAPSHSQLIADAVEPKSRTPEMRRQVRPEEHTPARLLPSGGAGPVELYADVPRNAERDGESWAAAEERIMRNLAS
jgi:hypothetical protein